MGSRPSHYQLTSPGPLRLLSMTELLNMPAPSWLIDNVVPEASLVAMYAAPESFKSFIAIDLALCVATGKPWMGHETRKGLVIYIGAEGGAGIGKRALAWLCENQVDAKDVEIAWLVESIPVNANSEEMAVLMDRIANEVRTRPVLIVVDTLARCFDGDENQQEDMGRFIAGIDMLRKEFECAVMVVHHTRLGGDRERGNTALRGAMDTMLYIEREEDAYSAEIVCAKQKDSEHFETMAVDVIVVEGTESCVVRPSQSQAKRQARIDKAIEVLTELGPCKWDDWVQGTGMTMSQFMKVFGELKKDKAITKDKAKGLWSVAQP